MVWMGRKAQLLARRGMDIRTIRPGAGRSARCSPGWRIPRPTPDAAACGRPHPNCGPSRRLFSTLQCWRNNLSFLWSAAPGTQAGQQVPALANLPRAIFTLSFSTMAPCLAPGNPSIPDVGPAGHRSRSAASRSHPLFFQGLRLWLPQFLWGKPVGQRRQHRRLISLDPHQIVPSVVDYGLHRSRSAYRASMVSSRRPG